MWTGKITGNTKERSLHKKLIPTSRLSSKETKIRTEN
jgi:hypothetical protein